MTEFQWTPCSCHHAHCKLETPDNLGSFYQGCGFLPAERERIEAAFRSARLLREAYATGEANGGSIEWDQVDLAHEAALRVGT